MRFDTDRRQPTAARITNGLARWLDLLLGGERDRVTMDGPEKARIAADLGMGVADLEYVLHAPQGSPDRLHRMMGCVGLDPQADCTAEELRDLQRICSSCRATLRCRLWLHLVARHGEGAPSGAPGFCASRYTFSDISDRLAQEDRGRAIVNPRRGR